MSLVNLKNIFNSVGTTTGQPQTPTSIGDKSLSLPIYDSFTSDTSILRFVTTSNTEPAFPTRYTPLNSIIGNEFKNRDILGKHGWPDLYEANHKSIILDRPSDRSRNPFQPFTYKNSGGLDIKHQANSLLGIPMRYSAIGLIGKLLGALGLDAAADFLDGKEPYVVSRIPKDGFGIQSFTNGRFINAGGRNITPAIRSATDTVRIAKYLTSPQGILNMALKNADLVIPQTVVRDGDKLTRVPQRFNNGYNPLATLLAISPISRLIGHGPNFLIKSGLTGTYAGSGNDAGPLGGLRDKLTNALTLGDTPNYHINDTFTKATTDKQTDGLFSLSKLGEFLKPGGTVKKTSSGDKMTLAKMIKGDHLSAGGAGTMVMKDESNVEETIPVNIEKKEEGMPFYFKDLRDKTYIFFRAYLDGISESISPEWTPTNYIGRSEPVFVYGRSERSLSFNLTLFAQTEEELGAIYAKMNKLTSLCYPEYAEDEFLSSALSTDSTKVTKTRMKPPLMRMRMGDLFGKTGNATTGDKGVLGFLESLTYTIPTESTWETENGKKVPKYIQVAVSYKVLHDSSPDINTKFYGYEGEFK